MSFCNMSRCLVPESRGATLTREGEEALWQAVLTAQPGQRREFEPSSKRRKKRPASWPSRYGLSRTTVGRLALAAVPAVFLGLFFVYPLVSIVGSVIGDVSPGTVLGDARLRLPGREISDSAR